MFSALQGARQASEFAQHIHDTERAMHMQCVHTVDIVVTAMAAALPHFMQRRESCLLDEQLADTVTQEVVRVAEALAAHRAWHIQHAVL